MAVKSNVSRLLGSGEPGPLDAPLDHAPLVVEQFEFYQAQQLAGSVDLLAGECSGSVDPAVP